MIDIHCHALFGVDDGSQSYEESVEMLKEAKSQGIEAVILTPHYRHGMFAYPREQIEEHFARLQEAGEQMGMALYLGCEYHVNSQICEAFSTGRCHRLADKRYILTEYSHVTEYPYMVQMTREVMMHGYIPVLAHVERYGCLVEDPERVAALREMGAWIQVNADAVLGMEGRGPRKFCKLLLQEGQVDVVASDSHGIGKRACHMRKCFQYIEKKYGADYATQLMCDNPAEILR